MQEDEITNQASSVATYQQTGMAESESLQHLQEVAHCLWFITRVTKVF